MVNEPCHASGDNKKSDTFYSPFSRYKGEIKGFRFYGY